MLQTLKKAFFAVLPSLRKAAEDALRDNAQQSQAQTNHDSEQPQTSNAPKPGPGASKSAPSQQQSSQGQGSDYPGDYRGSIDFEYSPSLDGDPDPGEIVWTWVPYEEDHTQGKDRPVILVGRDGEYLLAFMMTSKDHNNRDHADSNYLDIGSGSWDSQGRASEVKLNRVLRVRPENMRREGAIMPHETFRLIEQAYNRH